MKAFVGIDYDEFEPETYRGVMVNPLGGEITRFESGDFVDDWNAAMAYVKENFEEEFIGMSSVDHFFMDGAPYEFVYNDDNAMA